ncbi:hypothetical protein AQUCO_00900133v1 [Aquilegia coerulea]|uniref:RBR-type E3 ubiquitin transferase n=1 Tax=Aquilegia coerulea TaxID=218851 RepID=A0A2G5EC52_AQUCA|nr:hypothetical protein AQUCO_00900133v1 [Aquilegia coerulea]
MEFEDDLQYASDSDLIYDYSYDEDDVEIDNHNNDDDHDHDDAVDDNRATHLQKKNYTILSENDIQRRQEEVIYEASSVLSISRASACILLRHYSWNDTEAHDSWFADEEKVRTTIGLLKKPLVLSDQLDNKKSKITCGICFEDYYCDRMYGTSCGHLFCRSCWKTYISTSIKDGPGCLNLRCPELKCGAIVGDRMVDTLAPHQEKENYHSKNIKWCPAQGCNYAVEIVVESDNYDVLCKCGYSFCWNCIEDAHRPVNKDESENVNWMLVYSKPSPKCKRPIEKSTGCNHMSCTPPCNYQFCWLCLRSYTNHTCNSFAERTMEEHKETENRKRMAKELLDRYGHYYERQLIADLQKMKAVQINQLIEKHCQTSSQVKFITEAWEQIIECRRVLKWTYTYGYYQPEDELTKKQLFEFLQGMAETGLERLHSCAEKDLKVYIEAEEPSEKFYEFRTKLTGLTSVTREYFEKLVQALENGLADVDTHSGWEDMDFWYRRHCTYANDKFDTICQVCNQHRGLWSCQRCTYLNKKSATVCKICNTHL